MNGQPHRPHPTERAAVSQLQRFLRQLSYFDSRIPPPPIDGIFDTETRAALVAFQAQNDLPQTGTADYRTWTLLYTRYTESLEAHAAPLPLSLFPALPEGYTLQSGDRDFTVRAVQFVLNELSVSFTDTALPAETLDAGVYDQNTADAVSAFQTVTGLPVTGKVDLLTWNRLVFEYGSGLHTGE